jgi:hypothetical protein
LTPHFELSSTTEQQQQPSLFFIDTIKMAGSSQSVLWGEEACVHNIHQYIPDSVTAEAHSLETWTPPLTLKPTPTQKYWVM